MQFPNSSNEKFLIFSANTGELDSIQKEARSKMLCKLLTINYIQSYRPVGGILEMFLSLIQSLMKTKREKNIKGNQILIIESLLPTYNSK